LVENEHALFPTRRGQIRCWNHFNVIAKFLHSSDGKRDCLGELLPVVAGDSSFKNITMAWAKNVDGS
jgi:hypothetical protein